ncbi:uncharacterized protein LOC122371130 [Amphibalanus amphitrite]|uniref:uncharacterized protein LOC122371130 n=1 Tax=Amphibalanus amphitrite TaxID=1232801 RepID=UPI001C8FEF55|nr:uncharacterized protein LOC122371130 [Amphibalanus amphitrite]
MSKQNLSTLSDIPEEKTTSVSADSLENTSQGTAGRDKPNNGLNVSHSSNVEFPSFNNILSSSHCDVASVSKSATLVGSLETHHHHHKVSALFISEDAPTAPHKPHVVQRYLEITQDDETRICKHNQSAEVAVSSPRSKNTGVPESSPANTAKQEAKRDQSRTKAERQSRIPVAVRSLPVIARLRQNIEKQTEGTKEPEKDPPKVKESDTTPQVAAKAPKAVERCRSHHIIDRPEKDFIQLNKQGEFRRTKTYHHLHLERRHKEKAPDSVTSKPSNSEVGEATAATPSDAPGSGERQTAGSAAGPAGPIRDSEVSGQTPGARSSPRVSEPRSPRAGSEGSGGRRSSRIPVRAGPSTSPRRRHQSHESPRDHVSRHESHVSRRDFHTFGRGLEGSQLEFHESRLSYGSSESELLLVPKLHLQTSQPSLIDVNDNRRLLSEVSAPSLLDHQFHRLRRRSDLIILDDNLSSLSLQLAGPRKVYTPPDRVPMPHRHVPYQPNLKPYPRQYVKLGKLGPDPAAVKARQEKMQKQQEYADQVAKKNRTVVKPKSQQYSKQQDDQKKSAHDKMLSYAKTVPKPKQKPKPRAGLSPNASREVSPMTKIRKLLAESNIASSPMPCDTRGTKSNDVSPVRSSVSSPPRLAPANSNAEAVTSAKPPQAGRPVTGRQPVVNAPEPRPPPMSLPTFEAPKTSALPPKDNRRRPRRSVGRSASVGQARVANSLSRLRTLTDQLVTGTAAVPAVDEVPRLLRRDDSCPTLGASSDMDSEYSTDSLIAPSRPTVVSMGRSYGSTSPRGRGLFPPTRGAPGCRRPMSHCSRGVGPERPGAATQPVAEDFFFDTCGGHGECACGDQSCSPPLSPHRRPVVTRGTQSVVETPLNETFVVHKNPLVVDIGMPVGAGRTRRSSPRRRLGGLSPDSLAGSPPQDWRMGRPDEVPSHASVLHMMRERHLRDKRRVDAIISGSITRM